MLHVSPSIENGRCLQAFPSPADTTIRCYTCMIRKTLKKRRLKRIQKTKLLGEKRGKAQLGERKVVKLNQQNKMIKSFKDFRSNTFRMSNQQYKTKNK